MIAKRCLFWGVIVCLSLVLESRVIVPRNPDEEIPLSLNPLEKDNKLGIKPAVWAPPIDDTEYFDYSGNIDPVRRPPKNDYDYNPGRNVNEEDNQPGTNPERFPTNADPENKPNGKPEEKDDVDKSDDGNSINPHDVGNPDKSDGNDKDFNSPPVNKPDNENDNEPEIEKTAPEESEEENDENEHKPEDEEKLDEERKEEPEEDDNDKEYRPEDEEKFDVEKEEEPKDDKNDEEYIPEDEEKPNEERKDDEEYIPEDEEKPNEERKDDEEEKYEPGNDDEKKHFPEEESTYDEKKEEDEPKEIDEGAVVHEDDKNGDESIPQEGEQGFFSGGSIFDTPFFNLEKVKKYFSKLDRALGHVFRQTLDEALLLNGTYANTTEEEVDIGGKKYIVTKSVLKGADNNSVMYVEALSTKPKMNGPEGVQDIEIKNITNT